MNPDTPRTDAAIKLASDPDGAREVCDLCEQMERELAEMTAHKEAWQMQTIELENKLAEVRGTLHYQTDALTTTRCERDSLAEALERWPEIREWLEMSAFISGYMGGKRVLRPTQCSPRRREGGKP